MNNFELIKDLPQGKYDINDNYKWSKEFIINMQRIDLDGYDEFENDTFKIVPFEYDHSDCNCYIEQNLLNNENYEDYHMHSINCNSHATNFYHKPTGICIVWGKHVDNFECINKDISYEEWCDIVQDCIKSVLKETYTEPIAGRMLTGIVSFGEHNISETIFIDKFKKFLKDNGWSFSNSINEYYECKTCGKELTDETGDKLNGYCWECINNMLEC